jgi:hypothetical protein
MAMDNTNSNQQLKHMLREMNTFSVAYLDTVEVFFRYMPKGLRTILERTDGRRVLVEDRVDTYGRVWGYRVILHQPKVSTLKTLDRLEKKHRGKLCRVDVAYDFSGHSRDWLERHSTMRWRRRAPCKIPASRKTKVKDVEQQKLLCLS